MRTMSSYVKPTPWFLFKVLSLAALCRFVLAASSSSSGSTCSSTSTSISSSTMESSSSSLPSGSLQLWNCARGGSDTDQVVETTTDTATDEDNDDEEEEQESMQTTRKRTFLDRMALASSSLLKREQDAKLDQESTCPEFPDQITPQSDLLLPGRYIHIVTTAALPWSKF
jgi:hypothetical protein